MDTVVAYPHIEHTNDGIPFVAETNTKVEQIALDHIAYGWSASEIHRNHPYLTLAQIFSALAYYYDNQEKMDTLIEEGLRLVTEYRARQGESPVRLRLRALGLLE